MATRFATADGQWVVDVIHLSLTGTNRDGQWIRVRHHGYLAGEVRNCGELAKVPGLPLTDLVEVS
jgi:hypothetical protein